MSRAPPPAGSVPASWATPGSMTRLAALHLGRNALTGSLPVEWGQLPRALPRLTVLGLQGNRLSGTLPPEWGAGFAVRARCLRAPLRPAAQALREAHLEGNALTGTLPAEWGAAGSWRALEMLQLQGNALRGAVPAAWGRPAALPGLSYLCGPAPTWVAAPDVCAHKHDRSPSTDLAPCRVLGCGVRSAQHCACCARGPAAAAASGTSAGRPGQTRSILDQGGRSLRPALRSSA